LTLQQERLATVWDLMQAVFERGHGRAPVRSDRSGSDPDTAPTHPEQKRVYSQEERDRLLGKRPSGHRPDGTDRSDVLRRPRRRDDDRER
jgi:hypothetical protein